MLDHQRHKGKMNIDDTLYEPISRSGSLEFDAYLDATKAFCEALWKAEAIFAALPMKLKRIAYSPDEIMSQENRNNICLVRPPNDLRSA